MNRRAFLASLFAATATAAVAKPAKRAALTLPGTPYAVRSVVRYRGWFGPCVNVRNPRTGVSRDIGFRDNVLDQEKLRAFLGDPALTNILISNLGNIVTWYDQTGNGRHLTQATTAEQPSISAAHAINGVVPVCIDGCPTDATLKLVKSMSVSGISLSTQSMTCLQWTSPVTNLQSAIMAAFTDAGNVGRMEMYTTDTPGMSTFDGATTRDSFAPPKVGGSMAGFTASASALIHYVDTVATSFAAPASNTVVKQTLGRDTGTVGYNNASVFCDVLYASALSAGDVELARKQMAAAFWRGPATVQLIVDSHSSWSGYGSTGCNENTWYLQAMLPKPVQMFNMSVYGRNVSQAKGQFSAKVAPYLDMTKPVRVYMIEHGVNDISAGTAAATVYGLVIDCVNLAKAAGFTKTVVCRVAAYDANYIALNNLFIAGEGTDFDVLVDGWSDARFVAENLSDGHLNSSGQVYGMQNIVQGVAKACGF
jgi:hypothetical protein